MKYLSNFFRAIDLLNIVIAIALCILFFQKTILADEAWEKWKEDSGCFDLYQASFTIDTITVSLIGVSQFMTLFKIMELFKGNNHFELVTCTILHTLPQLKDHLLTQFITIMAFAWTGNMIFYTVVLQTCHDNGLKSLNNG